jgi:hypothetical protein
MKTFPTFLKMTSVDHRFPIENGFNYQLSLQDVKFDGSDRVFGKCSSAA